MSPDAEIAIESVVPHRGRMLMVDRLLTSDEEGVSVSALVRPDNLFAGVAGVPVWVGIEYMAQAIAAWAGCRALRQGKPVQVGFLLGTRRYDARCQHFEFGTVLRIDAHCELFGENGLGMFTCRITHDESELAVAQVSVFEPPDPIAFLEGQAR